MKLRERVLQVLPFLLLIIFWDFARYQYVSLRGPFSTWPTELFLVGLLVLCAAWICSLKCTAAFTVAGYLIGFLAGWIFQRDGVDPGGGDTNNLWAIWLCVFVVSIIIGVLTDLILFVRRCFKK